MTGGPSVVLPGRRSPLLPGVQGNRPRIGTLWYLVIRCLEIVDANQEKQGAQHGSLGHS